MTKNVLRLAQYTYKHTYKQTLRIPICSIECT